MQLLNNFEGVISYLAGRPRRKVAVVCPHDDHTREAIEDALNRGIADFVFVGAADSELHRLSDLFPGHVQTVELSDSVESLDRDEAARHAVAMIRRGEADVLMKGLINTDNLLRAILNKVDGILAPGNVLTHITASQIQGMDRLLFFSDAAVIPAPTAEQFSSIVGYMADVCKAFGNVCPRIALIHCTEKTSEKFPVTLAYAEIKERASRGLYGNAVVDGPMDVKSALDIHSGELKGVAAKIEGRADGLVFPDIQAGNVFYKTISYFADSLNAGMLMGAQAPVVLPSRADSSRSKLCSLAMACLYASTDK